MRWSLVHKMLEKVHLSLLYLFCAALDATPLMENKVLFSWKMSFLREVCILIKNFQISHEFNMYHLDRVHETPINQRYWGESIYAALSN